jgi:hypothetical protein
VKPPFIPPRTRAELASPAAPGDRHKQMVDIAVPLIGNGMAPQAVFAQLRAMYDPTVTDAEIESVIAWVVGKNPAPSGYGNRGYLCDPARPALPVTPESASAAVEEYLKGFPVDPAIGKRENELDKKGFFRCDTADYYDRSLWRPLEDWRLDSLMLFAALFFGNEFINIVTKHTGKGKPDGIGRTKLRDDWMRDFRKNGIPQGPAGAWYRFNPTTKTGSGDKGGHTDDDVTAFRFMLIESDKLPMELQLSFFGKLRLPIAALYSSGGKSIHCLVKMDCTDADQYREQVARILNMLRPYGFDASNKNASRLSRLPGASREIGANENGEQRLLYLNPEPVEGERIFP